ncbi:MAG: hydrogenase 4 subunit B [Bauldia sp.]|nr:hydrogenase 4 subunit B [Bauldia sp.]
MISPLHLLVANAAALLALAAIAIGLGRSRLGATLTYGGTLAVSILTAMIAAWALLGPASVPALLRLPLGLPWLGVNFRLDTLAAFFLLVIGIGCSASSLHALGYGRHETSPERVLPFFPAFLAGMTLVVLADDAFTFLIAWEFMSLASWALVLAHHHDEESQRAGFIYLVMASAGTLCLLLAFGLLAGPGGAYGFDAIRAADHGALATGLVLVLVLIGAGSKAGIVPLHVWLPLAHPAAPSHVSALMSGVMTKVAIYGFVRVVFDLLGGLEWWVSVIVLVLGAATALLGILHALMESDLKRVLAYSTIENVGIIFVSLGLALAFRANGMSEAAALAFTAALFHVLNHSVFKSLLFFGAGAILAATGERNMERLGGLIHRMPVVSAAFLVGCVSVAALPPFNGFASEWLVFQAILLSPDLAQWNLKLLVPAVGGVLALAAALSAACFVRAFGISFLGRPRSPAAERAVDANRHSLSTMIGLAALCLLAGLLPGLVIDGIAPVSQALIGDSMPAQSRIAWLSIAPIAQSRSSYNGLLLFLFIAVSASLAAYVIHRVASREARRGPAWGCGFPVVPAAQYSADSFAQPIRRVFGSVLLRARERVNMPAPGELRPAFFRVELHDFVWEKLYAPIERAISFGADNLNRLQFLTIRQYLSLVFVLLVVLLLALAL